ncbi:MAG: hypothetical protein ACHQ4J_08360 [Candidatus Binatia bacterium]
MTKPPAATVFVVASLFIFSCVGCGTSGSNPIEFPEVHFAVQPQQGGQTTFTVDSLVASGIQHMRFLDQPFVATATFEIILENAAPPYHAVFSRPPGEPDITVMISVIAQTGQTQVIDTTSTGKDSAVLDCMPTVGVAPGVACMPGGPAEPPPGSTPSPTPATSTVVARFDVCAPSPNATTCFTATDSGIFGIAFSGTLGDLFTTHLLNGTTPSIYFLEGPSHSINAVFRSGVLNQPLLAQMYINGVLRQGGSGTSDIVFRQDL